MKRAFTLIFLTGACGDDGGAEAEAEAEPGNPLGVDQSLLPFPCSYYLREDASSETGARVDLLASDVPVPNDGTTTDPAVVNDADGFSPSMPILIWLGDRLDSSNLPPIADPGQSLDEASPSVIVDMQTGDRVPHFAELDETAPETERQALILRPMQWLERGRRYAVGVTSALSFSDGSPVGPTAGFQAILDGDESDPRLARIAGRYPDIFAALAAAGVARGDLALAFDYVTASETWIRRDLMAMREQALDFMGDQGQDLAFTIEDAIGDPAEGEDMILRGTYESPLFLSGGPDWDDYGPLARGADGLPERQGVMEDAPFTMVIPASAATDGPFPLLHYGHGLLGSSEEAEADWLRDFANEYGYVVFAHNWMGLSEPDTPAVIRTLTSASNAPITFDRLKQGVVNAIALTRVARYQIAAEMPELVDASADVAYHGNSLGGIMGTVLMAWSPDLERGVLGVGAGNFSVMLQRSANWPPYSIIIEGVLPEAADQLIVISLMQMLWDPTDGISAAAYMFDNPPPDTPAKQILMQIGVGDSQVPNIASDVQARTMGIAHLGSDVVHDVYELTPVAGPLDSALTYWDYGCDAIESNNVMGKDNGVHEAVRRTPAAQRQMDMFLRTGVIAEECAGACWCTSDEVSTCAEEPATSSCE